MTDAQNSTSLIAAATLGDDTQNPIDASLNFVREHLGMEVAYLSEFVGDDLVFRAVSAPGLEEMVYVGGGMPLDQVYCRHILAGRLPELIPNTAKEPFCDTIALTHSLPIKSHVSVPIMRQDGTPYGMFCCLSRKPQNSLNERDLTVTRAFAKLSADQLNETLSLQAREKELHDTISSIIGLEDYDIVYQPIKSVNNQRVKGYESLCRFRGEPYRPPNLWFDDALHAGMQCELEVAVIEKALRALNDLPNDVYLSVNASPDTVAAGVLRKAFESWPAHRIVLEVTEHCIASDYDLLFAELKILRNTGVRVAIDDAGAGYSGLQHIVQIHPDIIKLDISLTTSIDTDVVRRSLGAALVGFGCEIGAAIVAEGVETQEELDALNALDVPYAQGYFLDRPAPLDEILSRAANAA